MEENGFVQGQINAFKDAYKNTDANEVLNKILEKIQSFDGFASGTELGDTLQGIQNLAKNITAPFKQITSGWNQITKTFKDFKLSQEEDENKEDNHLDNELFSKDDYAKDDQIIDLGDSLKSLIHSDVKGFEILDERIEEQKYFLEDIQTTVSSLIYGTDAIIDQLKKNQKNTKVFQVQKKEMTLAEKMELGQGATQIGLLQQIRDDICDLDTDLNENIADAISPNNENTTKDDTNTNSKESQDNQNNNKTEIFEQDKKHNRVIDMLKNISKSISTGTKFLLSLARSAVIAATKTALIITGILSAIVAIDLLQAVIRTKWDEIQNWFSEFKSWLGDSWDKLTAQIKQYFQEYIEKPFDILLYWNKQISTEITKLGATLLEGLGNVVDVIPGTGDAGKELLKYANQLKTDAELDLQKNWDDFAKKNGNEKAEELLGKRVEVQEYKMDDNTKKSIKEQAEIDKDDKKVIVELKSGEKLSLNSETEDLEEALREYSQKNDEIQKQNAEIIENLLLIKKERDKFVDEKADEKEFSIFRKGWNKLFGDEDENRKNEIEVKEIKDKATKDFNEEYLKDGIVIDTGNQIKGQISEKERQENMMYDPNMQLIRNLEQDRKRNNEQKNNVQVNTQNNNTNIINQPLSTSNPMNNKKSRTNIGHE